MQKKNTKLSDIIQKKRGVARSSARTYSSALRRVHNDYSDKPWHIDLKWLEDESILNKLKQIPSINVRRNLGMAVVVGLGIRKNKTLKSKYDTWLKKLRLERIKLNKRQEMTDKQKNNFIGWDDIIKLKKLLAKTVRLKNLFVKLAQYSLTVL